jgi:hypothetical protein
MYLRVFLAGGPLAAAAWFPAFGGERTMTFNVLSNCLTLSLRQRLLMYVLGQAFIYMCVLVRQNCMTLSLC